MAGKIKFTDEGRIEFHKAKCFFEFTEKADEFWDDVNRQFKMAISFPEAFQMRYKNVRIINLQKFNYSVHYVVKPYGILIYRFLNQQKSY